MTATQNLAAGQDTHEPDAFDAPRHVGTVSLTVRDLAGVTAFYRDMIGLDLIESSAAKAVLGAGGRPLLHLNHDAAARLAPAEAPGLFHTAFLVPTRRDLARWLAHAAANRLPLEGASDHIVSEALYLSDPEGNGIEIYADRPRSTWKIADGQILMDTLRLDLDALMGCLRQGEPAWTGLAEQTRIGHVHLKVGDTEAAAAFYDGRLGFAATYRRPGAVWMGAGGYHHHLAGNSWMSRNAGPRAAGLTGLTGLTIIVKDAAERARLARDVTQDPWGLQLDFVAP